MSHFELSNSAAPPALPSSASSDASSDSLLDPRAFGFSKVAYSVNEALQILSMGRSSLYKAIAEGRLQPVKNGKQTLFLSRDLCSFLAGLPSGLHPDRSAR
jgi:helix-turn-helix protein